MKSILHAVAISLLIAGASTGAVINVPGDSPTIQGAVDAALDGDEVRENLSKGLGFSQEDRDTNIRRIGYVAKLLSRNGTITITAAISPYAEVRQQCRSMCGNFVEIHTDCSIEELTRRDVKGLYAKALSGEIKNFTGISDPYEAPENPELDLRTADFTPQEAAVQIIHLLKSYGKIPALPS